MTVVKTSVAVLIALAVHATIGSAFAVHPAVTVTLHRLASSASAWSDEEEEFLSSEQAYKNANDLFASKGWEPIQRDLDQLPVFTCANEQGKPLAYTIETTSSSAASFTVPCFYCDVDDAQEELRKARENTGLSNLDLIPFPMGKAFMMWSKDEAIIIPNKKALVQAGAPPNTNPLGQHVPLFACMDIMRSSSEDDEDGNNKNVLPLFMDLDDANAAVEQAVQLDGGNIDELEVVSLSLNRAVELLATVPDTPAFQFIAPEKSFQYIQKYLTNE